MLRPSLLDLDVPVSVYPAPEYLLVFSTFAHVDVMMTTSVDGKKVLTVPVVVITVYVM